MKYKELHDMVPHKFELFVGQVFSSLSYNVLLTSQTSDGGVDLIVDKYDDNFSQWIRYVVQVKRYKSTIGIDKVRELNGVLQVHHAAFGSLITLSGFKKGVKQKAKADFPQISLLDGSKFYELLNNASMLDAEGNLILSTDPNLEKNRRYTILKILRENQPNPLSNTEVIDYLKSNHFVTVSDAKLKVDIAVLQESGNIIVINNRNYYSPKQSEIQIALNGLSDILKNIDYFISDKIVFRILEDYYSINRDIWRIYFKKQILKTLDSMVMNGQLHSIGNNLYATSSAIDKFRTTKLDSDQMKENIDKILELTDDNKTKAIKNTKYYPKPDNVIAISGADEKLEKLMPFLTVLFSRCPDCGALTVGIVEIINLYITSDEIENRLESLDVSSPLHKRIEEISKKFVMSKIFIERLGQSFEKYFGNTRATFNIQKIPVAALHIALEIKEDEKLEVLRDKLLELSERYQSLLNEIYAPIEDFGRPVQLHKIDFTVKHLSEEDVEQGKSAENEK